MLKTFSILALLLELHVSLAFESCNIKFLARCRHFGFPSTFCTRHFQTILACAVPFPLKQQMQELKTKAHWGYYISTPCVGNYQGRWCHFDQVSLELRDDLRISRSYVRLRDESEATCIRQVNTQYDNHGKEQKVRGAWNMTEVALSTARGIIHPSAGDKDMTFLALPSDGATAWVQHRVAPETFAENETWGLELLISEGGNPRSSVAVVYAADGRLKQVWIQLWSRFGLNFGCQPLHS